MAKPHRMAMLTAGCVLAIGEAALGVDWHLLRTTLITIAAGAAITVVRRTAHVLKELDSR
jgi:hypothetical protein